MTGATPVGPKIARDRLRRHAPERLIGRDEYLGQLDAAWENASTRVVTLVAWGGVGKTSLVAHWLAGMAERGWDGAEYEFEWTFYSGGTRDDKVAAETSASADIFIAEALEFFADPTDPRPLPTAGYERGVRLAELVARRRSLLVLDGVEPLQYPPSMPDNVKGRFKDPIIEGLLVTLARQPGAGLCVVTTREHITDLGPHYGKTAREIELSNLIDPAGAALLHHAGATHAGSAAIEPDDGELQQASREVEGHALTLTLLGGYLARAHGGDIRRRDRVKFEKADARIQGGHAFRVIKAYEAWFASSGEEGARQLALLRLLGFFDHPADPACLAALCRPPALPDLTEPLLGLDEEEWNCLVSDLEKAGLLRKEHWVPRRVRGYDEETAQKKMQASEERKFFALGDPTEDTPTASPRNDCCPLTDTLDAHPLVREYFAAQLRGQHADVYREGHRRLYDCLCGSVPYWPEGADGLQPLYQAVAHGCRAGLYEEARAKVYRDRILRGTGSDGFYSALKLGLIGSDLGAVACFFTVPWSRLAHELTENAQTWLLNEAACSLLALGRLIEALEPMHASLKICIEQKDWREATIRANNLCELELTLGDISCAVQDAERAVDFANSSRDAFQRMARHTTLADALHRAGRRMEAWEHFSKAEEIQAEDQPEYHYLYSVRIFHYCDLLLSAAEHAAWNVTVARHTLRFTGQQCFTTTADADSPASTDREAIWAECCEVKELAEDAQRAWLEVFNNAPSLLDIAIDHLTLGHVALYQAILEQAKSENTKSKIVEARKHLAATVDGLRAAGTMHFLPGGLLSRAWLRFVEGDPDGARADLEEAWEIAERGAMKLHMADVLLYRARLFRDREALVEARKLIEECGYWRRKEELADAEEAAKGWPEE